MRVDPWGELHWLWERLPRSAEVRFLGALGAEDRCTSAVSAGLHTSVPMLVRVEDPESRYTGRIRVKTENNRRRLHESAVQIQEHTVPLLARDELIAQLMKHCLQGCSRCTLLLDISCLPKRFFFLLTKLALSDSRVENLIVIYTQAGQAGYSNEPLAEDPEDIRPLPGFAPSNDADTLCVAVGFESLGLPRFIGEYRDRRREVFVLVPFPPGQPYSERIWRSLHRLDLAETATMRRVPAMDAFGTYHALCSLVNPSEDNPIALAPYGPKPLSLGMAMYAIRSSSPVFYTQPRIYHAEYTIGIGKTWAYCIKASGRTLPI